MTTIRLKDQQEITIRPISLADTDARHQFWIELSIAQVGMVHTIDEIDMHTHETHDKIVDFSRNHRGLWLIAVNAHNEVVGEVDITIKDLTRVRHAGLLTIGVVPSYQGLGLGNALMTEALAWAKARDLRRIELSVFSSNHKAQGLYFRHGFVVEGLRKLYVRHEDGRFEDDLLMAKYL